ncbi:MAG TPA: protein kinase, partial [Pseudomonadota bacterium]|nr:protein kinase [Pseudomonadota bacterium]
MMLQAGARLGPYQVVSLIAVGGMGEVYRAHDGRLHRDVAVKVLTSELAKDAPRLLRFEKEALAVSSLSHPNILTLYDVGTFQGMPYMVAELIEGKTLRERLTEGAVPIRKAVDYTLQIAAGLAAAHDKGVIHRDLKPENLLLTPDGRVKILDFGLAKLSPSELPSGLPSDAARTAPGDLRTDPAVLMGTPGYMSPEQIQGLPVDARSDIFALGLILYELLYGRRAFARPSVLEMTMAILKEDPQMDTGSERLVPTALQRVIQRCLEKNPQERFHSARDIAYALEAVSAVSDERPLLGQLPILRPPKLTRRAAMVLGGTGLLGSYAAAIALGQRLRPVARCFSPRFRQLTFRRGVIENARFAADGNTVVYGAAWEQTLLSLYEVRTDQPQSRLLYSDAHVFALSGPGELAMVRFGSPELPTATLARAPLAGGAPRDVLTGVHAADWSPDGTQLAVICASERKFRLEYPIGRVLFETSGLINQLRVSPDGQRVVFLEHPVMGDTGGVVAMVDVKGRYTVLTRRFNHLVSLAFHPSGNEVWFSAAETGILTSLWAVNLEGEERVLLRGAGALRIHDVARDGRAPISQDKFQCAALARPRGSREEHELSWFDFSRAVDLSADGQTLLFDETGEGGGPLYSTFVRKLDGSPAVRLGEGTALALSPDGRWALAVVPDKTPRMVLWPTGPGQPIWL